MSKLIKKELDLGHSKLTLETGELATHASGSVLATCGETVVLATAVSQKMSQDVHFFPLSVDYEERHYAGGKISTSRFIKREGRPTEKAVLTSRLIDRSIRPLFPKDYRAEVQVIVTVLSIDAQNDPGVLALVAASAALSISDIPWNGPLSGIRVSSVDGKYVVNATEDEKLNSPLDLIVASSKDEVVMIEASAKEVPEKEVAEAIKTAVKEGAKIIKLIEDLTKEAGKPKQEYVPNKIDESKEKAVNSYIESKLITELETPGKAQDEGWFAGALERLEAEFIKETEAELNSKILSDILDDAVADFLRTQILTKKKRIDGRAPDEIRPLTTKVGILPRTHGSAIFQRGDTQVLSIVTLASPALEQLLEGMDGESKKRYMHHYNFPPFSAGEVRRMGSPGRREIGHGALAEKALLPVIPDPDIFPYTLRVVSEVLSSAGSTSMAAASGSTLALMDAGVPIKEPVAGISIGLITDKKDRSKYVTLTDIAYQEDAQGDMDFKVAGTKNGVTAIQMDIKLNGIALNVVDEALDKAKVARTKILEKILSTIPASRESISKHAPSVIIIKIDPAKIGEVIGSGGRTINRIIAETGAAVDIDDSGTVTLSSKDQEATQKAAKWVEGIVKEPMPGEIFEGPVKRILPFGAMVEYLPGKEGLVHISKLAPHRVETVEDVVKIGQVVKVRVAEIDDMGRINLSMNLSPEEDRKDSGEGNRGGGNRGGNRGPGDRRNDQRRGYDKRPRKRF